MASKNGWEVKFCSHVFAVVMVSLGSSAASESKTSLELLLFVTGKLQGHSVVNVAKRYFHSLFREPWWLKKAVAEYSWKYIEPMYNKPFLCRLGPNFLMPYPFHAWLYWKVLYLHKK